MTRKEKKAKVEEIKKNLTPYEAKWFDSLYAEYPNEDLSILVKAAKEQSEMYKIQQENEKRRKELYELEERREYCYFKYRNDNECKDCDLNKRLIVAFYCSMNPESLMGLKPAEILATCTS